MYRIQTNALLKENTKHANDNKTPLKNKLITSVAIAGFVTIAMVYFYFT